MLKRVAALPPRSVILFIYLSVDAAGVSHEGENVVNRLHAVANAPIFSWIDLRTSAKELSAVRLFPS